MGGVELGDQSTVDRSRAYWDDSNDDWSQELDAGHVLCRC
jgi:hypothetical protein